MTNTEIDIGNKMRKLGKGEGRELEHELLFFTKLFLRSE